MKREHLIKSAKYWYDMAELHSDRDDCLLAMKDAYTHVENALGWVLGILTPEQRTQFEKIQVTKSPETKVK